jgi:hypothetical protein
VKKQHEIMDFLSIICQDQPFLLHLLGLQSQNISRFNTLQEKKRSSQQIAVYRKGPEKWKNKNVKIESHEPTTTRRRRQKTKRSPQQVSQPSNGT